MFFTTLGFVALFGFLAWGVNRFVGTKLNIRIFNSLFGVLRTRQDHFRLEKGDLFTAPAIYGEISQAVVDIGPRKNTYSRWLDIHISFQNEPFFNLRIQPLLGNLIHLTTVKESIPMGDPVFDREFYTRCSDDQVLYTLLTPQVRQALVDIKKNCRDFYLNNESLHIQVDQEKAVFDSIVPKIFSDIDTIVYQWEKIADLKKCLLKNSRLEMVVPVKLKILNTLVSHYSVDIEIKSLLRMCMQDADDYIRLFAAGSLDDEGVGVIIEALNSADDPLVLKGINAAGRNKSKKLIPFLLSLYKNSNRPGRKEGIVSCFRNMGDTELNDFLLKELAGNPTHNLEKEIILALRKCGTIKALESLYYIKQKTENYRYSILIEGVIRHIREKYGYKQEITGRLSITNLDDNQGNLSIQG